MMVTPTINTILPNNNKNEGGNVMKTKQGKEFNYSDILLYSVAMKNIVVIVNDEEQMKKFARSGKASDAPIAVIPYTDEELTNIIDSMKQIEESYANEDKTITVKYKDGEEVVFDASNESIIKANLAEQRKAKERKVVGAWANIPEKEKEERKKTTKKKFIKGLSAMLAATVLAGGLYAASKFGNKKFTENNENNKETTSNYDEFVNPTDPRKDTEIVVPTSDYTKEAEELYNLTATVNPFILKYQQVANVTWDKELALEVIEYINTLYPTSMQFMNEADAKAEAIELQQAISLLIAGNLNPETKEEEMIDLSQFMISEKEKVLVHNAMTIARACIQESIGEPMNGKIIETDEEMNKFSREYTNSVDQLLHYEFDTINDPDFLVASSGARFVISSIFQTVNNTIPQWSHVTRQSSEQDPREYELYYRYFNDDYNKVLYLPEPGQNGTNVYYAYWADETSDCHKAGPYTEDVMHAMAGLSTVEEQRNLGIEANPNIRQLGIQTEVDNRVEDARVELFELAKTNVNTK